MHYDEIFKYVGDLGRYQIQKCVLLSLPGMICAAQLFSLTYIAAEPKHRCCLPGFDCNSSFAPEHAETWILNQTTPQENALFDTAQSSCQRTDMNVTSPSASTNQSGPCSTWVYDRSQYKTSIVSEWDLVCGQTYLVDLAKSVYLIGTIVGSFAFGNLSDRFGRKKTMICAMALMLGAGVTLAFSQNITMFIVLRFILGAAGPGIFQSGGIIGLEIVGPSGRVAASCMQEVTWALGFCYLSSLAYFLPYWKTLQLVLVSPLAIFICCWKWAIPESPRWLVQNNKLERAKKSVRAASIANKTNIPESVLAQLSNVEKGEPLKKKRETILAVFRNGPRLFICFLCVTYMRFSGSLIAFALSFNSSDLPGGNDYLNLAVMGLVGIPANFLCIGLMDRMGRRPFAFIFTALASASLIAASLLPDALGMVSYVLFIVGRLCTSVQGTVIFTMCAELFPTVIRAQMLSCDNNAIGIGGALSPFVLLLGDVFHPYVPGITLGVVNAVGILAAWILPETRGIDLPETLEDAVRLASGVRKETIPITGNGIETNDTSEPTPTCNDIPTPARSTATTDENDGQVDTSNSHVVDVTKPARPSNPPLTGSDNPAFIHDGLDPREADKGRMTDISVAVTVEMVTAIPTACVATVEDANCCTETISTRL